MIGDEVRLVPRVVPTEVELRGMGRSGAGRYNDRGEMLDVAITIGDFGEGIGAIGDICEALGAFGGVDM